MKQRRLHLFVLAAALFLSSIASAVTVKWNGLMYNCYINENGKAVAQVLRSGGVTGDVTIAEKISYNNTEYTVTSIQEQAFYFNSDITSVAIPSTIKEIPDQAFYYCKNLKSIAWPAQLASIGKQAFYYTAIDSLFLPDRVETLSQEAFSTCINLKYVELPKSLKAIGEKAFYNDGNIRKVMSYIEEPFAIPENVFFVNTSEGEMFGWGSLYVPAGTKDKYLATTGWNGFSTIEEMEPENPEPETPDYKDGEVFTADAGNGLELRYTVISATEKTCMLGITKTLEGEYYPTALADGSAGKLNGMNMIAVFLQIPSEVNGYKVIEIASQALFNTHLTGIKIPSTVTKIGERMILSLNLKSIIVDEDNHVYDSRDNCNAIVETATNTLLLGFEGSTIAEGIEIIGKSAFSQKSPIEIHIPKSVKQIVENPFVANQATERVTVAEDNPFYDSRNNCNAIINTATGELVTGCKTTVIPEGVTRIGKDAFASVPLAHVQIPQSVTSIGIGAFYKARIEEVILPSNLLTIEKGAFQQNRMEEIVIPASVTTIGTDAFFGCSNLKKVTALSPEPIVLGEHAFDVPGYTWTDATLYVPAGSKAKYEVAEEWKKFKNIVEMDNQSAIAAMTNGVKTSGSVYNLNGQRVEKPARGIFIKNGKKFIIK